ncbi:hypothetical protein [Kocuria sp.]|uniref:hypothetical protein n=1 Tax=Kocuria sp. TaxID=1871328 RepID=UPI0026DCF1B3|nr:hypothetical protein [Kocuria sp.]MDO4918176.1 hypothetical protein [Kocuria sp.]
MSAAQVGHDASPPEGESDPGVTEVVGRAEDLQAQLFGPDTGHRPAAEGFDSPERTAAAVEGARTSIEVHGGAGSGAGAGGEAGPVSVDTEALQATSGDVGRLAADLGGVLTDLTPLLAELELWALTGQPLLGEAVSGARFLVADLLGRVTHVEATASRLHLARLHYELTESALVGSFASAALERPLGVVSSSLVRDAVRTVEDLDAALTRADVTSPQDFLDRVEISALGVVVRGGGPNGTDAVVRGPGLDDALDAALLAPTGVSPGRPGTEGVSGAAPGGAPSSGAGAGADGGGSAGRADGMTLGQYLRGVGVGLLTEYGRVGCMPLDPADERALLAPVVAAMTAAAPGMPPWYRHVISGRHLAPGEEPQPSPGAWVRGQLEAHALRPARREVFTGLTPANGPAHHLTGAAGRPLPAGVAYDGAVPTTVAGTAAAVREAKTIVSGTGSDAEQVDNSTVLVQKAVDEQGRTAYSVVLTGTEEWTDGSGVHDLKGIGEAMTASPSAGLTELPQAQRMAVQALRDAGIRPGDTVVLSGHSLGGIDAAGLASNREFRKLYDVAAVTTFGAPVGDVEIPGTTSVMAVEHQDDLVPTLDGVPNPDSPHRSTVRVGTPYDSSSDPVGARLGITAHEMSLYTLGAQGISAAQHPAVQEHEQRIAAAVPHGAGVRTESYVYEGREEHAAPAAGRTG